MFLLTCLRRVDNVWWSTKTVVLTSSNRWQAIPVQPVWRFVHPEGKPAATHQAAHRRKTLQMPLLQLRLSATRCSHWSFAHPCWYDSTSHAFYTHFPRRGSFPFLWCSKSWSCDVSVWGRPLLKSVSKPVQSECLYYINHHDLLQKWQKATNLSRHE